MVHPHRGGRMHGRGGLHLCCPAGESPLNQVPPPPPFSLPSPSPFHTASLDRESPNGCFSVGSWKREFSDTNISTDCFNHHQGDFHPDDDGNIQLKRQHSFSDLNVGIRELFFPFWTKNLVLCCLNRAVVHT